MTESTKVEIEGREFIVEPVRVGDLPAFLAAAGPVMQEVAAGDLVGALTKNAENVIRAVSIATGADREWLDKQRPDALLELAGAVIEVNADFFTSRIVPMIEQIADRMSQSGGESGSSS